MPNWLKLVLCVLCLAASVTSAIAQKSRKPGRAASPDKGKVASAEEPDFTRFRIVTDDGILAVFDADEDWDGRDEPYSQLAYWHDFASEQFFFFDQLLFTDADVLQSIAAMQRDLNIDHAQILSEKPEFDPLPEITSPGQWRMATEFDVLAVMAGGIPDAGEDGEVSGGGFMPCAPANCPDPQAVAMSGSLDAPIRGTSRTELFDMVLSSSRCRCTIGGGSPCNDHNLCTTDTSDPVLGCMHTLICQPVDACTGAACKTPWTGECVSESFCGEGTCCPGTTNNFCCFLQGETCCEHHNPPCCPPELPSCCGSQCCQSAADCCNGHCKNPAETCPVHCCSYGWETASSCAPAGCAPYQVPCNGACCGLSACKPGSCVNNQCVTDSVCEDGNPCTDDPCTIGQCGDFACNGNPNKPNGTSCPADTNPCTNDHCIGGQCSHPPKCDVETQICCGTDGHCCDDDQFCCATGCCGTGQVCCGGTECCAPENCCAASDEELAEGSAAVVPNFCCAAVCNHCINNGQLQGGTVTATPDPGCVGETITWTASGVTDIDGKAMVQCVQKDISDGVEYEWTIMVPTGYPTPLPPLQGTGSSTSISAMIPGTYSCTFVAKPLRTECRPADLTLPAKSVTPVHLYVDSVTFGGSVINIKQDQGSQADYQPPHWKDNSNPPDADNDDVNDRNIPVAYVRSTPSSPSKMTLTAVFNVDPASVLTGATTATVTGTGSAGGRTYVFTGTAAVTSGTITLTDVQSDIDLPDTIDYLNRLEISWVITLNGGQLPNCTQLVTKHRVYVLLGTPNTGSHFETLIHLSCTDAAGKNNENDTVAAIWNDFTDRVINRKPKDGLNNTDGSQLTYYANWNCGFLETAQLLANGDGQCGAWSGLMLDLLGSQGINPNCPYVQFFSRSTTDTSLGFHVKNWTFGTGSGSSGDPNYPFRNLSKSFVPISGPPFAYNWLAAEVNDAVGVAGQGTANPASLFWNHQVVRIGTTYYDPSYGVQYASLDAIDIGAIDAYYETVVQILDETVIGLDLNGDGDTLDTAVSTVVYKIQHNPRPCYGLLCG